MNIVLTKIVRKSVCKCGLTVCQKQEQDLAVQRVFV